MNEHHRVYADARNIDEAPTVEDYDVVMAAPDVMGGPEAHTSFQERSCPRVGVLTHLCERRSSFDDGVKARELARLAALSWNRKRETLQVESE